MTPRNTQQTQTGRLQQEIERCAYFLYEKRGCEPGHEMEDWLEAEKQVLQSSPRKTQSQERSAERDGEWKSTKQPARRTTESRRTEAVLP
jgi:hypothetical protein